MCDLSPLAFSRGTFTVVHVDAKWIRLDSQIATFTAMRKLQDLENSISCRRATFGKFKFKLKIGKFKFLPERFGKF